MTFGYSRDDVAKFLPMYIAKGILQHDPFEVYRDEIRELHLLSTNGGNLIVHCSCLNQVLDQRGVGQLVKMATERGRAARPNLKVSFLVFESKTESWIELRI